MNFIWGIILTSASLKVWIGQIIIAFFPKFAMKINIIESKTEVDKTYFLDMQGSALWDSITLWTLPLSGILLILANPLWTYFALIGGGMYLYFVGRNITSNFKLKRKGIIIGSKKKLIVKLLVLMMWGLIAIITIILALIELI